MFDALARGYEAGKKAGFLLGVPWEEHWETPLAELRRRHRIEVLSR